jgi:1-acyl-sn-glycerol-3-phosphate acyltransferase
MTPPIQPAIPAARNPIGAALLYWLLARPALRRWFDRVRVQLVGRVPLPSDGPLICYCNHPGWWDLYMVGVLERMILLRRFEMYGMMEEKQLRAYRFFTWGGAFSVHREDRREAARSLTYISYLLRERPGRALVIFPQGTITPNDRRPLRLYYGAARIVQQLEGAALYPITFRYEFRRKQRPEALMRCGPLHVVTPPVDVAALTGELSERLTASADALHDAVQADAMDGFRVLLRGSPGINHLFDRARQRLWPGRP